MDAATILASIFEQAFEDAETRPAARNLQLLFEAGEWRAELILSAVAAAVDPSVGGRPGGARRPGPSGPALDDLSRPRRRRPASEELSHVERLLDFLAALRGANHHLAARLRETAGSQQQLAGRALHSPTEDELRRHVDELAVAGERTRIAVEGRLLVDRFLEIAAKRIEAALLEASRARATSNPHTEAAERELRGG